MKSCNKEGEFAHTHLRLEEGEDRPLVLQFTDSHHNKKTLQVSLFLLQYQEQTYFMAIVHLSLYLDQAAAAETELLTLSEIGVNNNNNNNNNYNRTDFIC